MSSSTASDEKKKCTICGLEFTHRTSIYRHMQSLHKMVLRTAPAKGLTCPLCGASLYRHADFREHLQVKHDIVVEISDFEFTSRSDFELWKHQIEQETLSNYVLQTSPKKLSNNIIRSYYFCHRGGYYNDKVASSTRKRKMSKDGSWKIQSACPAFIMLTQDGKTYKVAYCKTHVGHLLDPMALPCTTVNFNRPVIVVPLNSSISVVKEKQEDTGPNPHYDDVDKVDVTKFLDMSKPKLDNRTEENTNAQLVICELHDHTYSQIKHYNE